MVPQRLKPNSNSVSDLLCSAPATLSSCPTICGWCCSGLNRGCRNTTNHGVTNLQGSWRICCPSSCLSTVVNTYFFAAKLAFMMIFCKFFPQGHCMNGNSCPFRHELPAGLTLPPMADAASFTIGRNGTHPALPHEKPVMPCHFFQAGKCKKGDQCPLAHSPSLRVSADGSRLDRQSAPTASTQPLRDSRSFVPCKHHLRGNCHNGKDCPYAHSKENEAGRDHQVTNDFSVGSHPSI